MNDELLKHFLELQKALEARGVSIILGGGMSLYINLTFRNPERPAMIANAIALS